jgi:hypothetical protein
MSGIRDRDCLYTMKQFKQVTIVLQFVLILLSCTAATSADAQDTRKEKAARTYYAGFVNKDWALTSSQLADGYTFSSPAGDDHISVETFKERCFPTSKFFKTASFLKMSETDNELFVLVQINTIDNKIVRNVDLFTFDSLGKIRAVECFFGAGIGYPGHNTN